MIREEKRMRGAKKQESRCEVKGGFAGSEGIQLETSENAEAAL